MRVDVFFFLSFFWSQVGGRSNRGLPLVVRKGRSGNSVLAEVRVVETTFLRATVWQQIQKELEIVDGVLQFQTPLLTSKRKLFKYSQSVPVGSHEVVHSLLLPPPRPVGSDRHLLFGEGCDHSKETFFPLSVLYFPSTFSLRASLFESRVETLRNKTYLYYLILSKFRFILGDQVMHMNTVLKVLTDFNYSRACSSICRCKFLF